MDSEVFERVSAQNQRIIEEAMVDHDKHYACLVSYLKRRKKTAHDLADMIGEGSSVAHAIWRKYDK